MNKFYLICCLTFLSACNPNSVQKNAETKPIVLNQQIETKEEINPKDFVEIIQNQCFAWQKIQLNHEEMQIFHRVSDRDFMEKMPYSSDAKYIYIKLLDDNWKQSKSNNSTVLIKQYIEKIKINDFNELIYDKYAQEILKWDKQAQKILWSLLVDMKKSQSFHNGKPILVADLANALLLILYGVDYQHHNPPIPIEILDTFDDDYFKLIKNQNFTSQKSYYQFLQKVWGYYLLPIYTNEGHILGFWRQDKAWLNELLSLYPDIHKPYSLIYPLDKPLFANIQNLKSLKGKLIFAQKELDKIQSSCTN